MNKAVKQAIEERLVMYWQYGPLNEEQPLPRYELRAMTGHSEQGTQFSRRLYSTLSEASADQLHGEIQEAGVPVYMRMDEIPLGIPAVMGTPQAARATERFLEADTP